jgi:hypothetical protein
LDVVTLALQPLSFSVTTLSFRCVRSALLTDDDANLVARLELSMEPIHVGTQATDQPAYAKIQIFRSSPAWSARNPGNRGNDDARAGQTGGASLAAINIHIECGHIFSAE